MFYWYKYLRVDDINEEGEFEFNELKNIDENTYNSIKNYYIEKDNLCISIAWTIGKIALIDEDYNNKLILTENCAKLIVNDKNIVLPRYLRHILNSAVIRKQLNLSYWQATIAKLSLERLKNIKIPLPPLEIQQEIVEKMDSALAEKKRLESESEKIMDSIDGYVLSELWIQLPKEHEEKNYFIINIEDIENWRLDVFYNKPEFKEIEKCILNSNYEVHRLWEYINEIKYGASIKNNYSEKWIPFLRIKDIQANQINIDEMVYLDESERKNLWNCYVHEWDFLISRSWSIWIVALVNEKFEWFAYWSFMIKFNLRDDGLNKLYVSYRLNNKVNQIIIEKEKIWAIQQNITIDTIKDFYLPLPPKEIQDKIANEVKNRIEKAKQFKNQATEIYEQAKNEVEKMILK